MGVLDNPNSLMEIVGNWPCYLVANRHASITFPLGIRGALVRCSVVTTPDTWRNLDPAYTSARSMTVPCRIRSDVPVAVQSPRSG